MLLVYPVNYTRFLLIVNSFLNYFSVPGVITKRV
ncbi:hypothetical protein [Vibrio phage 33Fb.4]|nr:hypothetical protein [Vibrio phage 33Fb.4]